MPALNRNQMAWRAAQDIADGAVVNLGIGMPVLVSDHLPAGRDVFFQSENGVIGVGPAAAPDRIEPDCPAFGECGGCALQHWRYAAQIEWKRAELARPLAGAPDVVPSPRITRYRNRAKLVAGPGGMLGSYAPASHRLVDMRGCRVPEAPIEPVVEEDTVEFTLTERGGGTDVEVVESGFDAIPAGRRDEAFRMNSQGWAAQMKNIRDYAEARSNA